VRRPVSEVFMFGTVLIGSDHALLEGLAQTLAAAGYRVTLADSLHDASVQTAGDPPLVVVVDRATALQSARDIGLHGLAPGGSIVLYHGTDDAPLPLPASLQRLTLADLTLPLERQRLVALVQSVTARARSRGHGDVGPEERTR
jgi:DNA-binding NtrC family response regulator